MAGEFLVENGRICRTKHTSNGPLSVDLCNFAARIIEEVMLDDGVQATRAFVVEGKLCTGERLPPARVSAGRFASMAWVAEQWGARAVVHAGPTTRDYLREAIQRLSSGISSRRVFTHTGWREVNGEWVYLTATGGLGRDDVEVNLDAGGLERYQLPCEPKDPVTAMQTSLSLLHVAPLAVTVPLWAAMFRAPLASFYPIDLSLWIEGTTGSLKSTLAALFLSHFGDFDRLHLPGSWVSTSNHLEHRAFTLKDTVFVVDDYAPRAALDNRELEAKAARVLRVQGNRAGRGRLRPDASERPETPPRGLILATGEQHPPGRSILARVLVIETRRQSVNLVNVTEAQRNVALLSHAMAGYLQWLGPQIPALSTSLHERFVTFRQHAMLGGAHLRVPEAIAHLWIGVDCGLTYAEEIDACSKLEAAELREQAWQALIGVGQGQSRLVEEERPTLRFLHALSTLVTQGRAVLSSKDEPGAPKDNHADFIGWYDERAIYLLPDAAFAAVTRLTREGGDALPIREERLRRELVEERLAEHDPDRHVKTVRIGSTTRKLLTLTRARIEAALGEPVPVVPAVTGSWGDRYA